MIAWLIDRFEAWREHRRFRAEVRGFLKDGRSYPFTRAMMAARARRSAKEGRHDDDI